MPKKSDKKVVFRKIRGRIVPIRVHKDSGKKAKSDMKKGLALVGGGIGTSVGTDLLAGLILGRGTKKAQSTILTARDLTRVAQVNMALGKGKPGLIQRAAKAQFGAKGAARKLARVTSGASLLRAAGLVIGAGITGVGINTIGESLSREESGATKQTISNVMGVGATILGAKLLKIGFKKGLGKKSAFKVGKKGLEFKFQTGQQF